ncbi:MAG TPA: LytR family transcriptional regulator, partial [Candidatus Moranbacteria bacterium]|nr:LytR family transcriptional regulator [Candidatus Moranbacteria bacterium]
MDIRPPASEPPCRREDLRSPDAEKRHRARIAVGEALLAAEREKTRARKRRLFRHLRVFLLLLVFGGLFSIGAAGFVFSKAYQTGRTITLADPDSAPKTAAATVRETAAALSALAGGGKKEILRGAERGRVNILLLGKGGPDHPGRDLTDTIMLASINTDTAQVALMSIPRDLYVTDSTGVWRKINSLYRLGLERKVGAREIVSAVEKITGQKVDYFLAADFRAFVDLIDAIGGINVDVPREIYDSRYPGPNYSYQTFRLAAGLQKLDGQTALKYVRSRHSDPDGDFGRAARQQQVLRAVRNKIFTLGVLANPSKIARLLEVVSENIRTDMTLSEMTALVNLAKNLDTQNITTVVLDAWKPDSLLRVRHFGRAFGLVPRAGESNYHEIRTLAEEIFDRDRRRQRLAAIAAEEAKILIISPASGRKTLHRL